MATDLFMDGGRTANLILVALVRRLMEKKVLSEDEVRALLCDAAGGLGNVGGDRLTPDAARVIAQEDLMPAFLGIGADTDAAPG